MGRPPIKDKFTAVKGKQRRFQMRAKANGKCIICAKADILLYDRCLVHLQVYLDKK